MIACSYNCEKVVAIVTIRWLVGTSFSYQSIDEMQLCLFQLCSSLHCQEQAENCKHVGLDELFAQPNLP